MSIKEQLYNYFAKVGTDALHSVRTKAWDRFLELGLPTPQDPAYQYVPLRRLLDIPLLPPQLVPDHKSLCHDLRPDFSAEHSAERAAQQNKDGSKIDKEFCGRTLVPGMSCQENTMVFVNGDFAPHLSKLPPKIVALPLSDALKSYGPLLHTCWNQTLKTERDPFALLNLALHAGGLFLYVPPKTKLSAPLQTLFFSTDGSLAPSRLHVFLAPEAEISWISTTQGNGHHLTCLDLTLDQGASFTHTDISSGWHCNFLRATLKQESRLQYLSLNIDASFARHSLEVILQGQHSDALVQGLSHLKSEDHTHTHVRVEHAAPEARSLQKFKAVLDGASHSSFSGKIFVHPAAEKTESYQLSQTLLLSEGAVTNAKPNLEIFNPNVKASHGATVSQVDEEQLFYLQSRGLAPDQARRLLVQGFIQEMIDQIPHPFLKARYATSF